MVIEHGVADPGYRYTGELPRLAFVVNEPVRRWRVTGTDLLTRSARIPSTPSASTAIFCHPTGFAMPTAGLCREHVTGGPVRGVARRRVYLHLNRWTSLGLSLIQAMMLGLPVVVVDATEASRAVPPEAGAFSATSAS